MKDLKAIVIELGTMLEQRGNRDEALTLIQKALKIISEQEVGFIDASRGGSDSYKVGEMKDDRALTPHVAFSWIGVAFSLFLP